MFSGIWYAIKKGTVQAFRNFGMTLASFFSITAMLLILALFFCLTVNVSYLTEQVKDEFDTVEIFLKDDTTTAQAKSIAEDIAAIRQVSKVSFISKEQALAEFKESWGNNGYLLDSLARNPLPNSLRVELSDIAGGSVVTQIALGLDGVEDVRFYRDEVNKILTISEGIQKGALIAIAFLVLISIVVVSNTIKITVLAREEEIEIMKYIGATNWFVRGPMFWEGIFIGLFSAGLALGLSAFAYIKIEQLLSTELVTLFSSAMVEPSFIIINLAWIFAALGVGIGACGSIISMRRFLKV